MKRIVATLGALTAWTPASAADSPETTGTSLITLLLIGFGVLIVVGQLIPGMVMLYGMIKGLFGIEAAKVDEPFQSTNGRSLN